MASSPKLVVTQLFIFNSSRRLYGVTLRKAATLANDHATTVQVELLLPNMSTDITTRYKSYTDQFNGFDAMLLTQVIDLTDQRRKYQSRLREIAEQGSWAAWEKFEQHVPKGCIAERSCNCEYMRIWHSGSQGYTIL